MQFIFGKDKTFSEILKIFQNKYIEIRKMLDSHNYFTKKIKSPQHIVDCTIY